MSILQLRRVTNALLGLSILVGCQTAQTPQLALDPPLVLKVVPQTNGVGTNREIQVVFSKSMDPASINSSSFIIDGVSGMVTYDAANRIGSFQAVPDFTPNTTYNARITTAAKDLSGTALAAAYPFSFTTRATSDTSAPYVVMANLAPGATGVPLDQKIVVTFDEQMFSSTVNPTTFFIDGVAGSVVYDVNTQSATFTPSSLLAPNTTYTFRVTAGAQDLGLVPLSPTFMQSFTTGPLPPTGPAPVALCPGMRNFSVLAGTTVTNTGPSVISGDVGVSPGTAVTGFPPGSTGGSIRLNDANAQAAQATLTTAYVDASTRAGGTPVAGDLVGKTLTSGVYTSTSSLDETGDLTLDAQGNPDAVFIFQISSTLTTGSGSHIILANKANACNVFWQVGSSATLGTNSVFKGNIMALASITLTTGVNLQGRALARNGAVTLDNDVVSGCSCQP